MKSFKLLFGIDKPFLSCYNLKLTGGVVMTKNNQNELAVTQEKSAENVNPFTNIFSEKIAADKYVSESYSKIISSENVSDELKKQALIIKDAHDTEAAKSNRYIIITGIICFSAIYVLTHKKDLYKPMNPSLRRY